MQSLDRAAELGQDLRKREFKDQSWLGLKTRSRDATLSRHKGININELYLHTKLPSTSPTGEVWRGKWQGNEIAAKVRERFSHCHISLLGLKSMLACGCENVASS